MGGFRKRPPVHLFLLSDQQNMKPPIQNHKSPVVASFLEKQRLLQAEENICASSPTVSLFPFINI